MCQLRATEHLCLQMRNFDVADQWIICFYKNDHKNYTNLLSPEQNPRLEGTSWFSIQMKALFVDLCYDKDICRDETTKGGHLQEMTFDLNYDFRASHSSLARFDHNRFFSNSELSKKEMFFHGISVSTNTFLLMFPKHAFSSVSFLVLHFFFISLISELIALFLSFLISLFLFIISMSFYFPIN